MNATVEQMKHDIEALTSERDGLKAARYAYATEFPLNEEGQPDVGSIHQNIRALKADHTKVMAAAKLALDALALLNGDAHLTMMSDEGPVGTYANKVFHKTCLSIEALRQAGVQ